MTKPLVSLLMAAYNNVAYIKNAIDSAKKQTYKNWELIILDDGSDDGTWELAEVLSKGDKRIKVHKNGVNIGYNSTMLKLSGLAKGDFYAHFDSDDMLERYAIEEMLLAFDQLPNVKFIYSDFAQIGKKGEVEHYSPSPTFDPNKLHQHGWRHFGMYRSDVMEHIQGYNEKLASTNGCADGDLFMQIVEKFPAARLPKVLYLYRNHGNNISTKNAKCEACPLRMDCNFARVWCKSANYDITTFKPIEVHHGIEDIRSFEPKN